LQHLFYLIAHLNHSLNQLTVFVYSTGAESAEKLVALEAELHDAVNHLAMTSSVHEELLQFVKNQQISQQMVNNTIQNILKSQL